MRAFADQRGEFLTLGDVELDARSVQMTFYRAHRHRQPVRDIPVAQARRYKVGDFPLSEQAADEVLSLPMFPEMTPAQLEAVAEAVGQTAPALSQQ